MAQAKQNRKPMENSPPKQSYDGCFIYMSFPWFFLAFPHREHHIFELQMLMALLLHDSILSVYSFKASHLVSIRIERCLRNTPNTQHRRHFVANALGMRNIRSWIPLSIRWGDFYVQQNMWIYEAIFVVITESGGAVAAAIDVVVLSYFPCWVFGVCTYIFSHTECTTVVSTFSMSSAIFMPYIK